MGKLSRLAAVCGIAIASFATSASAQGTSPPSGPHQVWEICTRQCVQEASSCTAAAATCNARTKACIEECDARPH
jgi:hypothetical protein